jgi:hypothetical protein
MAKIVFSENPKTSHDIWLKILIPIFSLLGMALIAEMALRLFVSPPARWTMKKQMKLVLEATRCYPPAEPLFATFCRERPMLKYKNNVFMGFNLREYPFNQKKADKAFRILGLGDSFAWGWGILDNRRTFFKLLECWLQKQNPTLAVEVINASKPGADADYYQEFLDVIGWRLNPDQIVISFNLNDAYVSYVSLTVDAKTAARLQQDSGFWTRNSRLISLVRERIVRKLVRREFIASVHDAYLGAGRTQRWVRAQANLLAIAQGCRKRGIALLVVIFPLLVDLDRAYPFTAELGEIVRFCQRNKIDCIDLLPVFLGKRPELLWILPTNTHPNVTANRLAAEAIFEKLAKDIVKGGH